MSSSNISGEHNQDAEFPTTGELLRGGKNFVGADPWDSHFPGLLDSLECLERSQIEGEEYVRNMLLSIKDTPEFLDFLGGLNHTLRKKVEDFMAGKSAEEVAGDDFIPPLGATRPLFSPEVLREAQVSALQ